MTNEIRELNQSTVLLVHCYGFDADRERRPDRRGRLVLLAALELLRHEVVARLVVTGGQISASRPPIGDITGAYGRQLLPHYAERIHVAPLAISTREEVRVFGDLVRQHGWTRVVHLGSALHLRRIRRAAAHEFSDRKYAVEVWDAESILTLGLPTQRYRHVVDQLRQSENEKSMEMQEDLLNLIDGIPYLGPRLLNRAAHAMNDKYGTQSRVLEQLLASSFNSR